MVDGVGMSTSELSIDTDVDRVDSVDILSAQPRKMGQGNGTYKKLYEELREELHEKQERLEIANYRVGQLEAQVRSSIPMLEYHRENYDRQRAEQDLRAKLGESTSILKDLANKIRYERFGKRVFLFVLLIVLALQPLWLLLISSE